MRLSFLVVSCLVFSGCNDATKDFERLADRACTCAEDDAACGNKVISDLVVFSEHHKNSDGDQSRINRAGVRLTDCLNATGVKQTELTAALERLDK